MKTKAEAAVLPVFTLIFSTAVLITGCGSKEPTVTLDQAKVTIGNYVGIEISVDDPTVTDEDIQKQAEQVIAQYNLDAVSDRTVVEDKDAVYISAYMYDEAGELLEDELNNHEGWVQIGSNTTYEELEQGLIGAEVGKELEIPITFPDPYEFDETLSGAKVICKATVQSIRETNELSPDTLTDEQAKAAFDVENVDGFYESIRSFLTEQNRESTRTAAFNQISEYLLATCTVDPFPDLELKNRVDDYLLSVEEMCQNYYNMTFPEYCASIEMTEEEYRADIEDYLSDNIRLELILTAIGDKEDIQYEEDAFQSYMDTIISDYDYESEEDVYAEYGEDYIKRAFRIEYVIDWLIDNADLVYVAEEPVDEDAEEESEDHMFEDLPETPADGLSEEPVEEPVEEPAEERFEEAVEE